MSSIFMLNLSHGIEFHVLSLIYLFISVHSLSQIGTDIEDFKCSWLVVQAIERANEDQMKILHVRAV